MANLPTVGSDDNTWGTTLNDYLLVAHNPDGTAYTVTLVTGVYDYYIYGESPPNINEIMLVDCGSLSNDVNIVLPDATDPDWNTNIYTIKKTDSTNYSVNVIPYGSQTVDGNDGATIDVQYTSVTLISDGSNWNVE